MRIEAMVVAAFVAACSGSAGPKGDTGAKGDTGSAGPAGGHLRAYDASGNDLGFVYGVFPQTFPNVAAGTTTSDVPMLLLKRTPAGASAPALIWTSIVAAQHYPCTLYYSSADCSGTPVVGGIPSGSACIDNAGHVYLPALGTDPITVAYGSRRFAYWQNSTFNWTCSATAGTNTMVWEAGDMGAVTGLGPRVYYKPND